MDWHDWLGNISEIFNVVVSGAALYFAIHAGRQARELRNEDIEYQRRLQASKISAWVADVRSHADGKWEHVGIVVQNLSEEPIYSILVTAKCQSHMNNSPQNAVPLELDFLPTGIFYCKAKPLNPDYIDFVPENLTAAHYKKSDVWEDAKLLSDFDPLPKAVTSMSRRSVSSIAFKDANGVRWKREKNGSLHKLADDE